MGRGSRESSPDSIDSTGRRRRGSSRSCSRSRSRNRRHRSRDRDYRPRRRSRSRSRSRSRGRSHSRSRSRSRGRFYDSPSSRRDYHDHQEQHHHRGWGSGVEGLTAPHEVLPGGQWGASGFAEAAYPGGVPPWRLAEGAAGLMPAPLSAPEWGDRPWHDDWGRDSSRSRGRSRDSDADWEGDRETEWGRRSRGTEAATASVFVKGLPDDADEADVQQLFAAFPNVQSVKVLRDWQTGNSRGMAFVDFATVDDARALMESEQRSDMTVGGRRLLLDYSHGAPSGRGGDASGAAALDWLCDMCRAVNFARRLECYHCYTARPANPRRVTADLNEPSNILKVSGLEPHASEEALYELLAAVEPNIVDMRVIKDKYTGAPRGFAFVELPSIAEAGKVMVACNGKVLQGQRTPLRICYAKAKDRLLGASAVPGEADGSEAAAGPGPAAAAGLAQAAALAAGGAGRRAAAAGPLGWKPKEFDVAAVLDGSSKQQEQPAASAAAAPATDAPAQQTPAQPAAQLAAAAATATAAAPAAAGPGPSSESAAAAAAAGVDAATIQALTQAGFEYQPSSGYWYDTKSGYYYDAKTQLYYHHSTSQWYKYDHATGQYDAVGAEQQQQSQVQQVQQQHPQQVQQQQQQPQQQQGQQQQLQQKPAAAADKRRRAVIGSAPQYNREGLLAAAALAKEREEEQKRLAAAKAARERQQQQQNKNAHAQKQQLMPGKPGIGALPGTGSAPKPGAGSAPPPAATVVAAGSVQGVVYKSKWAQRAAQQQG